MSMLHVVIPKQTKFERLCRSLVRPHIIIQVCQVNYFLTYVILLKLDMCPLKVKEV